MAALFPSHAIRSLLLAVLCALACEGGSRPDPKARQASSLRQNAPSQLAADKLKPEIVARVEAEARMTLANEASIAAFVRAYAPVFAHPAYREDLGLPSARCLLLLSVAEREQLAGLKLKVARADPAFCAGVWNGDAVRGNLIGAFEKGLSLAEFEEWVRLDSKAFLLALESERAVLPPATDDLMAALRAVDGSLSPDDSKAFRKAVEARELAAPAEGCRAYLAIADAAQRISGPLGDVLTRFVISPELVGPVAP